MMNATTSTVRSAARETLALAPLSPREDQRAQWHAHRNPVSLDRAMELVRSAAGADGERQDVTADLKAWAFGSTDHTTMQVAQVIGGSSAPLALRKHAFSQLASRLGVPAPYIANLPMKLQIACMNFALANQAESQPALLRLAGGEVRAILSDRYAALDDTDLLDIVDGALKRSGHRNDALVRSTAVGAHMLLRITIPTGAVEVKRGDTIEWGIDIANSELGMRSVQVTPMTYRLICTNGMRGAELQSRTRIRHVGDLREIRERVNAVVPTAFAQARGDVDRWRRSVDMLIDNALDEVEGLRSFGLGAGEVRTIGRTLAALPENTSADKLSEHLRGMRTSVFDLANAVTQTARDRADVASRLSLEETGYRYLARATR